MKFRKEESPQKKLHFGKIGQRGTGGNRENPRWPKLETTCSKQNSFVLHYLLYIGLPRWLKGKEPACQCRRPRFDPWVRKTLRRRKWQLTSVFLPGETHGQRNLADYNLYVIRAIVAKHWTHLSTHTCCITY